MARKPIPDATQNAILTKSRRRCCLCFWLKGMDEVQKGQIAHIDQDNENADEDNLVFLCFDHHDEYDGMTRLAKGLKPEEVRHWREELYKELEYRFRSVKKRTFTLTIEGFRYSSGDDVYAKFKLKNTGEIECRSPTVTIRLPEGIGGKIPDEYDEMPTGIGYVARIPLIDPWAASEEKHDMFEPNGRVCIWELGGMNRVLLAGHSVNFRALRISWQQYPPGSKLTLQYRVDGEGVQPVLGTVEATLPDDANAYAENEED